MTLHGGPVAVALVSGAVTGVGDPVAHIGGPLAGVGDVVAVVSGPVALVGEVVALVGGPLAGVEDILAPVLRCGAPGQPGLGRLQGLFGLPGAGLGRPHPSVIHGLGRDPLALHLLDDLLGDLGQLAGGRPRLPPQLLERLVQGNPAGGRPIPLACSIQTRLASACRS